MGDPDRLPPVCPDEAATIAYCMGDRVDAGRVERHIAGCDACRDTVAALLRLVLPGETPEEARLLDEIVERTGSAALALGSSEEPCDGAAAGRPARSARVRPTDAALVFSRTHARRR
jgi:hypothetical protein